MVEKPLEFFEQDQPVSYPVGSALHLSYLGLVDHFFCWPYLHFGSLPLHPWIQQSRRNSRAFNGDRTV